MKKFQRERLYIVCEYNADLTKNRRKYILESQKKRFIAKIVVL